MARSAAKKTAARKTSTRSARKSIPPIAAPARKTAARATRSTRPARKTIPPITAPAARKAPAPAAAPPPAPAPVASTPVTSPNGIADLAGGLQTLLGLVEHEVRSVSALSERIDELVTELNSARDEKAQRLIALDTLQASASDGGLTSFLDKLIRPRQVRVPEIMPDRLT